MVTKILFIEGSRDISNGMLAQGFHKLINQECAGRMPRIVMSNDKRHAIDKFLNNKLSTISFVLIDLDNPASEKQNDLLGNNLTAHSSSVFYMIQEMESWFLSQPEILNVYYGRDIKKKIKGKSFLNIPHPDEYLQDLTKNTKKGKYHKISHGTELLSLLNSSQLKTDCDEYKRLVEAILK